VNEAKWLIKLETKENAQVMRQDSEQELVPWNTTGEERVCLSVI